MANEGDRKLCEAERGGGVGRVCVGGAPRNGQLPLAVQSVLNKGQPKWMKITYAR